MRSSQQEECKNLLLEDDLNGCIRCIMGALESTSQGTAARDSWTRSAKTLAVFVIGIVLSGSAILQRVAESISLQGINPAKMTSSQITP